MNPAEETNKVPAPLVTTLRKSGDNWSASAGGSANTVFLLDPDRQIDKTFYLVHRKDTKNCPKTVTRCEVCRRAFNEANNLVVVKTNGERELYNKKVQKKRKATGNVYLHYLFKCLSEFDQAFSYTKIIVLKDTIQKLPAGTDEKVFTDKGCRLEQ